jgi:hypothetical protein
MAPALTGRDHHSLRGMRPSPKIKLLDCGTIFLCSPLYQVKAVMNAAPQRRLVMKNSRINSILSSGIIACALAIGSLASTQSASAQNTTVKVTIPFDFQTSSQKLPAGTYLVKRESADIIRLAGPDKADGFVLMHAASRSKAPDHGMLSFDHTGGKYYLRQIWTAGSTNGLECEKGRAEKAALVATNTEAVSTVELAFNSAPQK